MDQCRACLSKDPLQLFDWNVDLLENLSYMECFRQCTQLEELEDVGMFCYNCASELKFTYDFIQKARESDRTLMLRKGLALETEFELVAIEDEDAENLDSQAEIEDESNDEDKVTTADSNLDDTTQDIDENCNKPSPTKPRKRRKNKVHLCHICSRTFYDSRSLRNHTLTHEGKRERNYTCNQCGRKFFTQTACKSHAKTHDSSRQPGFKCDQCEKAFFYMGGLTTHKKQHTGDTVECHICQKHYLRSVDLEIHMRSHSGDTPYQCTQCDKAFKQVDKLNKHVLLHEGHRHRCDICEKEYASKMSLNSHRMQHTGMPMKCSICGKGFPKKSKMRVHIRGVHKVTDIEEIDELIIKVKTKREYRGRILEA